MGTIGSRWKSAVVVVAFALAPIRAAAQESPGAPQESPPAGLDNADSLQTPCRCVGMSGEATAKIERALRQPLHSPGLEFIDEPLASIADFLHDQYGIPILLDVSALNDVGLTADEPMTVNVRDVTFRSGLRLLLKPKQLTYTIRNEALIITTPTRAEEELTICVYDVRDLVDKTSDLNTLLDTIVACIATETWAENGGGQAEVRPLTPGLLVISQTQAVHNEIRELLKLVRELGG